MDPIERWTLKWAHGEATVQSLGAMLGPVRFDFAAGRSISPLHVAPWDDDPELPGIMRALRGERPCVPFGTVDIPQKLPSGFEALRASDEWNHGYGSNHAWQLVDHTSHAISLRIEYPDDSDIESLERVIRADRNEPALDISLTVHARRDVTLPCALHPTFAVPVDGVEIVGCVHHGIYSYPAPVEPDMSVVSPNRTMASLSALPMETGFIDATRLPLATATEEILQVADCRPPFILRYPGSGAEVLLDWDASDLPDVLLWISNGGRTYAPWSGKHFALGVEPVNGFFDLGRVVAPASDHPLSARSGLTFVAGTPRTLHYRISARPVKDRFARETVAWTRCDIC